MTDTYLAQNLLNKTFFFSRSYYILTGIALLSIPFTPLFYFFISPLLLILWIIEGKWKDKWSQIKESKTLIIILSFMLFWLINLIGVFYSSYFERGLIRTYDKLPFLIYPLVFFTINKSCFSKDKLNRLFKGFICTTTIMLLISWGKAFVHHLKTGKTDYYYYIKFSELFGHPAYYALIVCIAFCILFYFFNNSTKSNKWILLILMLFFALSIYFLQSRSGIMAFIIIVLFSIFYYLHTHNKPYWHGITGILAVSLFVVLIVKLFPSRIGYYVGEVNSEQFHTKNLVGIRSEIWEITFRLGMENKMIGIGSGYNSNSYLTEDELDIINEHQLFINAHNQFLQTFLEHGILGFCIIAFLFIYSFYYAIKTKNYLLLMLLVGFFINIFFESMLERGHGIFTFCLFYSLFLAKNDIFEPDDTVISRE